MIIISRDEDIITHNVWNQCRHFRNCVIM